jgi:hypothetical protein
MPLMVFAACGSFGADDRGDCCGGTIGCGRLHQGAENEPAMPVSRKTVPSVLALFISLTGCEAAGHRTNE